MYIKKRFSFVDVILWTRWELLLFALLAVTVTALFDVFELHWLQLPWTPIAMIGTAVAFLIGFQNNAAYGRTWEARKIWGGIVNVSRMWVIQVRAKVNNGYADAPVSDEALRAEQRTLVYRQIAWLTALRHAMRQSRPWEVVAEYGTNKEWYDRIHIPEHRASMVDDLQGLLSEEELARVQQVANPAATIMQFQAAHLTRLKQRGLVWEFAFLELQKLVNECLMRQGQSERIKNFPYPRQYATMGFYFVRLFIYMLPLGVVPEFAEMGAALVATETQSQLEQFIGRYFVWASVPFATLVSWVFSTMQRIGTVGENPFEGTANDVPISTMSRAIEIDLRQLLEEDEALVPAPCEPVYGVQM